MKLFNTIVVFDVYTVAETQEAADAAVLSMIRAADDPLGVSEQTALEAREAKNIRTKWKDERPLVAGDVSDEDFEKLKGKTTIEVHKMLYTKSEPVK